MIIRLDRQPLSEQLGNGESRSQYTRPTAEKSQLGDELQDREDSHRGQDDGKDLKPGFADLLAGFADVVD